jgi:hypothetical protein
LRSFCGSDESGMTISNARTDLYCATKPPPQERPIGAVSAPYPALAKGKLIPLTSALSSSSAAEPACIHRRIGESKRGRSEN